MKVAFVACALAGVMLAPSAWARALTTEDGVAVHHRHHHHHVARMHNPAMQSDAPQEAAPEDNTATVPEMYFHANGDSSAH